MYCKLKYTWLIIINITCKGLTVISHKIFVVNFDSANVIMGTSVGLLVGSFINQGVGSPVRSFVGKLVGLPVKSLLNKLE